MNNKERRRRRDRDRRFRHGGAVLALLAPLRIAHTLDGNRRAQALADALGHFDRVELVIDLGEEDELVSSEAGHHVDPPGHGGEPAGHLLEYQVAGGVVGPVVHQLEAVEVDEHHRE